MTYDPTVPAANQRISVTQEPIQTNFDLANTYFGEDHQSFTAGVDNGKHNKVSLRDQTGSLPTPGAAEIALYNVTTAGQSQAFARRDGFTVEYPVLPIKAFGAFTSGGALLTGQNLIFSAFSPMSGYTMTMPANTVNGTSYGVLTTAGVNGLNPFVVGFYQITNATTFQVGFRDNASTFLTPDFFTVAVLQL